MPRAPAVCWSPVIISSDLPGLGDTAREDSPSERFARIVGAATLLAGIFVAWRYYRAGLTLSHYDAKAHLVVARRIIDSITPGWQQIGAVWLPLPHLLNLLPVQNDVFFRTGLSAVAISVAALGLAAYALARSVLRATGSRLAAVSGAAMLALNPNLLYLQSTPMTEPLLIGLNFLATALVFEWVTRDGSTSPRAAGWALALACLTRYEAWLVTSAVLATAWFAFVRLGKSPVDAGRRTATIALYPLTAILGFLVHSRVTIGEWFVTSGFFVPDNLASGHPLKGVMEIWWGSHVLSGYAVATLGLLSAAIVFVQAAASPKRAPLMITLAPLAAAALPWYAFVQGHPFRIRYMIPVVAAGALCAGVAAGLTRFRYLAAATIAACLVYEIRPLDRTAPMVVEAQCDRRNSLDRRRVTDCLTRGYDGEKIMVSMGSLAHYMQETSNAGFRLRDFLHEGNGELWLAALGDPGRIAGWILVEERAEGGDMLAAIHRSTPHVFDRFVRVCEGGGVALYKRRSPP